ncbi:MAG: hypothetical protein K2X39_01140 [Silvanigrellaceae bacterium]|nr:hypothetical protein [Silvanigrellaceae bacterium]
MQKNPIINTLFDLKLIHEEYVSDFYPSTRDCNDVKVLRCSKSGIIFLSHDKNNSQLYYQEKKDFSYWNADTLEKARKSTFDDDSRRADYIKNLVINKRFLDIGTGIGGILDLLKPFTDERQGVEPQQDVKQALTNQG